MTKYYLKNTNTGKTHKYRIEPYISSITGTIGLSQQEIDAGMIEVKVLDTPERPNTQPDAGKDWEIGPETISEPANGAATASREWIQTEDAFLKAKKSKSDELKEYRDLIWTSNLTTSFGIPFKTDIQTQLDIKGIIEMLSPEEIFEDYKCADGVYRDITREQFQLAVQEGISRKTDAFAEEKQLQEILENATTVDEINAIL